MADGLLPGEYTLLPSHKFTVAPKDEQEAGPARVNQMSELVGASSALALEFAFDQLFDDYPTTALERLERAGPKALTDHLRRRRAWLLEALAKPKDEREKSNIVGFTPPVEPTGVKEIDAVRTLIAEARWGEALKTLNGQEIKDKADGNKRIAGLVSLYKGVVLMESSAGGEEEARTALEEAIAALEGAPEDLFRARVNFGNFLQQRANDRLNARSLQMAARVEKPMLHVLGYWMAAREQYEKARPLGGEKAGPALDVSTARLYSLLSDVIRALAPPGPDGFDQGVEAAGNKAKDLAKHGLDTAKEPLLRGIAAEVGAMVDFRAKNDAAAEKGERRALGEYLEGGYLAGAENVYRVLGLIARRSGKPTAAADAYKDLEVAQIISESLRKRFPPDKAGLGRAGFFARKAYVTELMVELLLDQDKPLEALQQLELAKARGLQDLLAPKGARPKQLANPANLATSAKNVIPGWDPKSAAIEYFLGSERAYVFIVGTDGAVTVHPVQDAKGKDVPPTELIADVGRLLRAMEGSAGKIFDRLVEGRGYDNSWEEDLSRLRRELLPDEALARLRGAEVVAVVPQHILHYFPFAALVVEKDPKTSNKRMAKPKQQLIDEPFYLVYAPSLSVWTLMRSQPEAKVSAVRAAALVQAPGAPPLEGVNTDMNNLMDVFKKRRVTVLSAEKARVKAAQDLLDTPGLVFFGTHGINVADRPLDSHLLLLPDPGAPQDQPGELTAGALFSRTKPIKAELIIMSCCYSGLGDRSPMAGDDLYGLQRGFIQSGAKTVISGLWDVYDGTAPDLMRGMFEGLEAGLPAAKALAETQRRFLANLRKTGKDEPWLHPYFWSVYTVAGDDRTHMTTK
jgi:hypothetical protein